MINNFLSPVFIRFLLAGFINTLFGYSCFIFFSFLLESDFLILFVMYTLGALFNFVCFRKLVFFSSKKPNFIKFVFIYFVQLVINYLLLKFSYYLEWNIFVVQAFFMILYPFFLFIFMIKFVYAK